MKYLREFVELLNEEAITIKEASELWSEFKDSAKNYVPSKTFSVRKVKDSRPAAWEVYTEDGSDRVLVGKFDTAELEGSYVPVRPNQKPDAEGYVFYRENSEVEAFKYEGETVKVVLQTKRKKLSKADYLIRETDGDNFVYSVQKEKTFESNYVESK